MNRFKTVVASLAAFALLGLVAQAQLGAGPKVVVSGTNQILGGTEVTNSYTSGGATSTTWPVCAIDCTGSKEVFLQFSGALTSSGTDKILLYVYRDALGDRHGWENTAPYFIWGVSPNGTAQFTACTNLTISGAPYLYIKTITNSADLSTGKPLTNFTLSAWTTKK